MTRYFLHITRELGLPVIVKGETLEDGIQSYIKQARQIAQEHGLVLILNNIPFILSIAGPENWQEIDTEAYDKLLQRKVHL